MVGCQRPTIFFINWPGQKAKELTIFPAKY